MLFQEHYEINFSQLFRRLKTILVLEKKIVIFSDFIIWTILIISVRTYRTTVEFIP